MDWFTGKPGSDVTQLSAYDSQNFHPVSGSPGSRDGTTIDGLAVTPDNKRVYVSWIINRVPLDYAVQVYDTSNMQRVGVITVGVTPSGIAFVPAQGRLGLQRAFVAVSQESKVSVIDSAALKQVETLRVGALPVSVAVTPDGTQLYAASFTRGSISAFDAETLQELSGSPIAVDYIRQLAPSPDGRFMFALHPGRLYVIDTATRALVGWANTPAQASSLAVSPDGFRVFVLCPDAHRDREAPSTIWMFLPAASGGTG
jgi:DNA-binding beta-propeller fold protein YncE